MMRPNRPYITTAELSDEKPLSALFEEIVSASLFMGESVMDQALQEYTGESLRKRIANPGSEAVVIAKSPEEIVGFAFARVVNHSTMWLDWVGVQEDWRGMKINQTDKTFSDLMIGYICDRAEASEREQVRCHVDTLDHYAVDAFTRWGFTPKGKPSHFGGRARCFIRKIGCNLRN